ncbi:MAG: class I SAM-dependent RNA methyltransferase [Jeotgalicoccus sp.]|nr:class I SAM-dependent RNA methyltransferase [Jeotgalicoccus sp.]
MNFKFIVNTPMGLERVVSDEIKSLGLETELENGRVYFEGDERTIVETNLKLRTVDRIRIVLGDFHVTTFDELFEAVKALPLSDILGPNAEFPVTGRSHKSTLFSVPDVQRITKKAIVEHLKDAFKMSGKLPEDGPRYKIDINILKDRAVLTVDTSGDALHKRGYRLAQGDAPIKETLAAAMLKLANYTGEQTLYDPFVGSGTIALEAAMIARNIAPGSNRSFDSESWDIIPEELWTEVRTQCENEADYDKEVKIYATDIEPNMINIAIKNAEEVGLEADIEFGTLDVHDLKDIDKNAQLVTNPPYGERIGEAKAVESMYGKIGELMKDNPSLNVYLMTSNKEFEEIVGKKATKRRKLFNGYIETTLFQYWGVKE